VRSREGGTLFSWSLGVTGAIIIAVRSIIVVKLLRTEVFEKLQQAFADDPNVEVVIDRRRRAGRRLRRETVAVERRYRLDRRIVIPRWNAFGYFITTAEGAP
jgi:hypothetical protein